ncbi:MAG TPA: CehA/McbA family metallohydrolase [Acidobacteriota bacterium]|nr:CehA/McbA family metallohydrolase [Acidobacteriota bacterium]
MRNYYLPPPTASTPWAPSWSPDGKSIAVAFSGSIWRVDVETGDAFELTYGNAYHSSPSWSPDGKWIVYTSDEAGRRIQLEILDVETGASRRLTNDEFVYADPVFSRQGDRLAYVSTRPNGYFNVYIRPLKDGVWAGDEAAVTYDHSDPRDRLYFGPQDMHLSPAWLPEGRELLILTNRGVPLGSGNVVRVPARENGIDEAETVLEEQTLYRTRPDVSIDGKRFVYSSTAGAADSFNNLYVQPIAGGTPYKLTFFSHDAFHPRWSPDGELIAYVSNEGGLPRLAMIETYGGRITRLPIRERRWKRPMGTLAVQVRDGGFGGPTSARIHLTASDGKFYAPHDSYARTSHVGYNVFHTAGEFQLKLPAGETQLTAVKGFQYFPQTATVQIRAGEMSRITLVLERLADLTSKGWYSGSTHVHMNYGGNLHNSLQNLVFMSEAEDQDVINEQVANKDNRILDYQFFVPGGGPHPLSTHDRLLVVGQEYRPPFYGHVFMLGLRDHLISPFTTGYEGTAIESLYPSNTDMLRKAKEQGATVGYVHPFSGEQDPLEMDLGGGKGFIVDAALGTTDALEWSQAGRAGFFPLYAVWNNGLRVAAVGGEDSISDLHRSKLVGSVRTFVNTEDAGLEMDAWFDGLRSGRSFVTTGPLMEVTVQGRMPGETIELPEQGGEVTVRVSVRSISPLQSLLVVASGEVLDSIPFQGDRTSLEYETAFSFDRSGWIHVRAEGSPDESFPLDAAYAQAFSNPVWIHAGGAPPRDPDAARYCLLWVDRLEELAEAWPSWRSDRERERVFSQFEEAREVYRRFIQDAP